MNAITQAALQGLWKSDEDPPKLRPNFVYKPEFGCYAVYDTKGNIRLLCGEKFKKSLLNKEKEPKK